MSRIAALLGLLLLAACQNGPSLSPSLSEVPPLPRGTALPPPGLEMPPRR